MVTEAVVAMVNRGGESLESGRRVATSLGWPIIGEDPGDLVLCDAGTVMAGFGFKIPDEHVPGGLCCSRRFVGPVPLGVNPASRIELVADDLEGALGRAATLGLPGPGGAGGRAPDGPELIRRANRLAELLRQVSDPRAAKDDAELRRSIQAELAEWDRSAGAQGVVPAGALQAQGDRTSFFDVNGNMVAVARPTDAAFAGKAGTKVLDVASRLGVGNGGRRRAARAVATPLVGVTLMVADVARSKRFYGDALQLPVLDEEDGEVKYDAGLLVLTITQEDTAGLVEVQRASGLLQDQLIFHTPHLTQEFEHLERRGVSFPEGIEGSLSSGLVAYFSDPDGHNLWLWQPPAQYTPDMPIDYFPVLERILEEAR